MKEFIKKCPFAFSLLISAIFVMDFYAVKYELVDLKLNQDSIITDDAQNSETKEAGNDVEEAVLEVMADIEGNSTLEAETDPLLHPADAVADLDETLQSASNDNVQTSSEQLNEEEYTETVEEIEEEEIIGITEFVSYEPQEVHSPYYKDPGKKALTTKYPYSVVDESYFDDAAFIGDSRTIGLFDYAGFTNADFYADNGFCAFSWKKKGTVTLQNVHEKVNLEEALTNKEYKKVYLLVGMNDCGYGDTEAFKETYEEMVEMLEDKQPNAIIYLVAIMNVTKQKSEQQNIFTSIHINDKNVAIAECANGINRFYLDYNDLYSDEEGYLLSSYSFDGIHLYGNKYEPWATFFKEHAIVKDNGAF